MDKEGSITEVIDDAITACTNAWHSFVLLNDNKAMKDVIKTIDLLDKVIQSSHNLIQFYNHQLEINRLLPKLLSALEDKNGIVVADTLEYELKPVLEEMKRVYTSNI